MFGSTGYVCRSWMAPRNPSGPWMPSVPSEKSSGSEKDERNPWSTAWGVLSSLDRGATAVHSPLVATVPENGIIGGGVGIAKGSTGLGGTSPCIRRIGGGWGVK